MKQFILFLIFFTIAGSAILFYTFLSQPHETEKAKKKPLTLTYKDPYVTKDVHNHENIAHISKSASSKTDNDAQKPKAQHRTESTPRTRVEQSHNTHIEPRPSYDRRVLEKLFFEEVNRQRLINDLEPLEFRKDLARTARKYSEELAMNAKQNPHYDPRTATVELRHFGATFGMTVIERLAYKKVYDVSRAGENILSLPLDISTYAPDGTLIKRTWRTNEEVVTDGVRRWMLSSAHRANILTPTYTHTGVGVFRLDNVLVVTQIFITKASCGYYKGPCCETTDACFTGFYCDTDRDTPECRMEE